MIEGSVNNINSENNLLKNSFNAVLNNSIIIPSNIIKEFIDEFEENYKIEDNEW
jgi:hypothetical protein